MEAARQASEAQLRDLHAQVESASLHAADAVAAMRTEIDARVAEARESAREEAAAAMTAAAEKFEQRLASQKKSLEHKVFN